MFKVKNRKINPEKSNKMIWAVGIGIFIIFAAYIGLTSLRRPLKSETEVVNRTLAYLRQAKNIARWEWAPQQRTVKLFYHANIPGDQIRVAHYAAMRLAVKIKDFTIELEKTESTGVEYRIEVSRGRISAEIDLKKGIRSPFTP